MPKFVRRQPLSERLAAYLNPYDFLLWLSEEIESRGWDQLEKAWALPIGVGLNLVFLTARANTHMKSRSYDDVFGDASSFGWIAWLAVFIVHALTWAAIVNTAYTFWRRKNYRLFENDIDNVPSTPSARRVRLDDSSPVASSPLRFLSGILGSDSAQTRAHPDAKRDVWEIAVWDPLPVSLRLFCYFSPGHVFIYWLFLPILPTEPRPSVKIVTAISLALLLSLQLSALQAFFSQQAKDSTFISKEVLHEYDVKYVQPRTQPLYRDVGTQYTEQANSSINRDAKYNIVQTYTPMVNINRGFKISPNPNYVSHPELSGTSTDQLRHRGGSSAMATPAHNRGLSPLRSVAALRQPNFRPPSQGGEGGSLGVYSHAASPLRKSASTSFAPADRNRLQQRLSPERRPSSPEKRMSMPLGGVPRTRKAERVTSASWLPVESDHYKGRPEELPTEDQPCPSQKRNRAAEISTSFVPYFDEIAREHRRKHTERVSSDTSLNTIIVRRQDHLLEDDRSEVTSTADNTRAPRGTPSQVDGERYHCRIAVPCKSGSKHAADEWRRKTVTEYYEQTDDKTGLTKERSMIRNVSRDDYLMARGANPRTGIVTPGVQSSGSSFDENLELKARGIAPPPKWRQRGDQWISLEFGQPTPVPTPTSESGHRDPSLRTPPRLTPTKHHQGGKPPPPPPKSPLQISNRTGNDVVTPSGVPGSFPKTPSASNSICLPNSAADHAIKRKAVGSPTKAQVQDNRTTDYVGFHENSHDLPVHQVFREDGMRSSSAPARHKPDPFCPADIGANINRPIPSATNRDSTTTGVRAQQNHLDSFLDPQPRRASAAVCQTQKIEKKLPCLPMSNGPFQSPRLLDPPHIQRNLAPEDVLTNLIIPQAPATHSPRLVQTSEPPPRTGIRGPRDMTPDGLPVRMSRPREPVLLKGPMAHAKGGRPMDVPVYDNPPPPSQEPPESRNLSLPPQDRPVQIRQRPIPTHFEDIFNMSTNTSMNTSTSTAFIADQLPTRRTRQRNLDGAIPVHHMRRTENPRPIGARGPVLGLRSNMNMNMSMSSNDLIGMPAGMARIRPREVHRPPMPDRAEAMRTVPMFDRVPFPPRRPRYDGPDMQPPYPWSTTGMPTTHSMPEIRGTQNVIRLPMEATLGQLPQQQQPMEVNPKDVSVEPTEFKVHNRSCSNQTMSLDTGLYRKCSRCTNGFVQDQQITSSGTASTPAKTQAKITSPLGCVEERQDESLAETQSIEAVKKEVVFLNEQKPVTPVVGNSEEAPVASLKSPLTPCTQSQSATVSGGKEATATIKMMDVRPSIAPRRGSENPLVLATPDDKDHTGCCPQCCKEQDCHDGCLGHSSPSPSPVKWIRSTEDPAYSRAGSITSLEGQPLTPLSERGKKLGLVRNAFKKSFQRTASPTKGVNSPVVGARINDVDDIDGMFSELSSGPASPGTFWGGPSNRSSSTTAAQVGVSDPQRSDSIGSSSTGAAAAAKAAIGMKSGSDLRKPAVLVKKQRANSKGSKTTLGESNQAEASQKATARKVTPNEGRRIMNQAGVESKDPTPEKDTNPVTTRRLSGASIATIEVPMPQITSLSSGISAACEMALVPFEASRMWLRNHPRVGTGGWTIINRAMEMLVIILGTMEACWRIVFVYSKTGKLRLPKLEKKSEDGKGVEVEAMTPAGFMWDCARSGVYVLIFLAMLVLVVRVVRWVLGIVRVITMVLRGMAWISKVLLGGGILW